MSPARVSTVTGAGSSGIFGGLAFKGQASFSNFALAHPGAKGLMTTSWTASQSGKQPVGASRFDAKAKSFASGYADLDRLLGATPALKGQAIWNGRAFAVSKADLTGAAGAASAARDGRRRRRAGAEGGLAGEGAARRRAAGDLRRRPTAAARSPARSATRAPTWWPTSRSSTCRSCG